MNFLEYEQESVLIYIVGHNLICCHQHKKRLTPWGQWVYQKHNGLFVHKIILKLGLLALVFPKMGMDQKLGWKNSNLVIIRISPLVLDLLYWCLLEDVKHPPNELCGRIMDKHQDVSVPNFMNCPTLVQTNFISWR